jgi:hypothetical protein
VCGTFHRDGPSTVYRVLPGLLTTIAASVFRVEISFRARKIDDPGSLDPDTVRHEQFIGDSMMPVGESNVLDVCE